MASVNKVILLGNLGRDPETRFTPNGTAVCEVSIATSSSWKDKQTGDRREETEWHRVTFIGRLAEVAGEYLSKGKPCYVEGRIKTEKWQDKQTGQDRYTTKIIADSLQLLGNRGDGGGTSGGGYDDQPRQQRQAAPQRNAYAAATGRAQPQQRAPASSLADMDDDAPF